MTQQELHFDPQLSTSILGPQDSYLRAVERNCNVRIVGNGSSLQINGNRETDVQEAAALFQQIGERLLRGESINAEHIGSLQHCTPEVVRAGRKSIIPRNPSQKKYLHALRTREISFGIGPAGTGKTYLAIACAVEALLAGTVERIILTRPAVEAGEKLGYLPGDLTEKVDPYMRPVYDALHEMLGVEKVEKLLLRKTIEIAPIAFMRGRTLSGAFIVLDEAQNCTREQMKMFLTRFGLASRMSINGDISQIDLPPRVPSGLIHAAQVLANVAEISFTYFTARDVVRHPLVEKIVQSYEIAERDS